MSLTLPCPAKINLFLEIRGRRDDGFHELGTLFQALETGDTLAAEPWDVITLSGGEDVTATPEDNLVVRAARLLKSRHPDRVSATAGLRLTLDKRLPSGAGLGGGSSDAATALLLANTIWNAGLTPDQLRVLGAELGSDVPFFLAAPTAYGEGRGEALVPAPAPYPFHVVVATPACRVETPWAYRELTAWREQRQGGRFGTRWPGFREEYARRCGDPEFFRDLHNDFEEPVEASFPVIRSVRETLEAHGPVKTLLSGSGASVFALFREETAARAARESVADRCRFSVTTRFVPA